MLKIAFMGAGSTIFARNVLGDVMSTEALRQCEIALYDIDPVRLEESQKMLDAINRNCQANATIRSYLGVENEDSPRMHGKSRRRSLPLPYRPWRSLSVQTEWSVPPHT